MPVPILKQDAFLIASVQTELRDDDLRDLADRLLVEVGRRRIFGVVIDVTAADVIDSFASRMLSGLVDALRLRGAETVVVGIQPEVAHSMVQLGLNLPHVETRLDLEEGLAHLRRRERERRRGDGFERGRSERPDRRSDPL